MDTRIENLMETTPKKWTPEQWEIANWIAGFLLAAMDLKRKGEL